MKREDLLKILEGDVTYINNVDIDDVNICKPEVIVYPSHVKHILLEYLTHKISDKALTSWAEFLCFRADYCSPNYMNDEMEDYYEDMWYVLQCLSTPEIDGAITAERVKQYLSELLKYDD